MRKYPYKKVNAFTSERSTGNPAAYLNLGKDILTEEEMLRIGKEHQGFVSEIVFCTESEKADIKLTYYSSECEVDFCGHGTIAAMYDIISQDEQLLKKDEITIETNKKGVLKIFNSISSENAIYITAPEAQFGKVNVTVEQIAEVLGIENKEIDGNYSIENIDAGLRTLIVPIRSLEREISMYPDEKRLKSFCLSNDIDIILIFSKETNSNNCIAHTRVFAPRFGYLEDPATGSGNSAFANYLLKNDLWNGETAVIEQGGDNIAYNPVYIKKYEKNVLFGGKATVVIDGVYYMNEE